jgi:hypothetical protein
MKVNGTETKQFQMDDVVIHNGVYGMALYYEATDSDGVVVQFSDVDVNNGCETISEKELVLVTDKELIKAYREWVASYVNERLNTYLNSKDVDWLEYKGKNPFVPFKVN